MEYDTLYLLQQQQQWHRPLTIENHRNAGEAGYGCAKESKTSGPTASGPLTVHHQDTDDVRRHLGRSGQERVEVRVAVQ